MTRFSPEGDCSFQGMVLSLPSEAALLWHPDGRRLKCCNNTGILKVCSRESFQEVTFHLPGIVEKGF